MRPHYNKDCIDDNVMSSPILEPSRPEQHIRYQFGYACSLDHHERIRSLNYATQQRAMASAHVGYFKPL